MTTDLKFFRCGPDLIYDRVSGSLHGACVLGIAVKIGGTVVAFINFIELSCQLLGLSKVSEYPVRSLILLQSKQILNLSLELFELCHLCLNLVNANLVHLLDYRNELNDLVYPSKHG